MSKTNTRLKSIILMSRDRLVSFFLGVLNLSTASKEFPLSFREEGKSILLSNFRVSVVSAFLLIIFNVFNVDLASDLFFLF